MIYKYSKSVQKRVATALDLLHGSILHLLKHILKQKSIFLTFNLFADLFFVWRQVYVYADKLWVI